MKKIYLLICLVSTFCLAGIKNSNAQCSVDSSLNGIYLFAHPLCDGVVLNPLCSSVDSVGTVDLTGYYDGDGYVVPLIAGTTVVISTDSCTGNPASLTMADSANVVIAGAYSAPACPNTLTFTATYTGNYVVVMNVNGTCGAGGTTVVGQLYAKIQPGTTVPDCLPATGNQPNDSLCGAVSLTLDGPAVSGNNTTALYADQVDELLFNSYTCSVPNNTLWYTFTSPVAIDTMYILVTSDAGGGFASWIGSFMASNNADPCHSCLVGLGCVAGADDGSGIDFVALPFVGVQANEVYYFMLDGVVDAVGGFTISLQSSALFNSVKDVKHANDFSVYPNPATSKLTIVSKSMDKDAVVSLINSVGQVVMTQNISGIENLQLDISKQPAGLYNVKITSAKGTFDKKVLITQ